MDREERERMLKRRLLGDPLPLMVACVATRPT
jgi:hypothetical protein